ncbi:MAG TPA: 50S ribosomal protein L18 [Candidatus Didemnitutus sp.]|nr:50S ribosomal protein L18 [Candidatus Didemnitutus sp.]
MNTIQKAQLLQKRKWRIRKNVAGTAARPRLSVKFSGKHIYAQAVDDDAGRTLVFLSTLDGEVRKNKAASNLAGAKTLGAAFAAKAKAAGVESVVFDRNGRLYHGRVKTFADAAREGGLKF